MREQILHKLAQAINDFLLLEPNNKQYLQQLLGSCIKIEITDLKLHGFLVFTEHGVSLFLETPAQVPDATISGSSINLIGAGILADHSRITLTGERKLAKTLQTVLSKLKLPIAELTKKTFGAKAAYWLDALGSRVSAIGQSAHKTAKSTAESYINEELALTVSEQEFKDFKQRVKTCRDLLARLNKCV